MLKEGLRRDRTADLGAHDVAVAVAPSDRTLCMVLKPRAEVLCMPTVRALLAPCEPSVKSLKRGRLGWLGRRCIGLVLGRRGVVFGASGRLFRRAEGKG